MTHKNVRRKIVGFMLLFLLVAIGIETFILNNSNKKQVDRTSALLLNQVKSILADNAQREAVVLEELKQQYIEDANTVAYILSKNEDALYDVEELKTIATMAGIDEIHLFDANGKMFSGTIPAYYGLTFDDGDQVAYFKPMLNDKTITMCQDVTPNTAESKSMMYAITWEETGTYMVQVGIEPGRLFQELKENSIPEVLAGMPVYEGMEIYVADIATGEILGATDKSGVGNTLYGIGILSEKDDLRTIERKSFTLNHFRTFCYFGQQDDHVIAVVHSTRANLDGFLVSLAIEVIWLLLAGSIITFTLFKLANANRAINRQMSILSSISDIYYSMHVVNMDDFSVESIEETERIKKVTSAGLNASDMLNSLVETTIEKEFIGATMKFVDMTTLAERLRNRNSISMDAIDKNVGWLRISFITVDANEEGFPTKVIITTQVIEEDKRREEELSIKANRDELTGLLNRRAYEDDLLQYPDVPVEENFVYAAIDVNGLKVVNDELGHAAGDELIKGAAACLKKTLGNYGRVYRTGGDEFVSMFFADEAHFAEVTKDLEEITLHWMGETVSSLTMSVGYVTKREFQTETVTEIAKEADRRMYEAKARHYAQKGVDRRGQAAAHTALCNLYTKILKINLTDDTFSIVNMDMGEQSGDKGFSDKISEWLGNFGKTGQVHSDDLEEYLAKTDVEFLKNYFRRDKTSISIHYRRKFGDEFKQCVMEMIPANDYTDENQSLFLYVKMVDR